MPGTNLYWYTGSAVGAAGIIRRRGKEAVTRDTARYLESKAVSALASIGGRSSAAETGLQFGDGLFQAAAIRTSAFGEFEPRGKALSCTFGNWAENQLPTRTVVSASVEGAVVVNRGPRPPARTLKIGAASFELCGVNRKGREGPSITARHGLSGLELDGCPIGVQLVNPDFYADGTFQGIRRAFEKDEKWHHRFAACFIPPGALSAPDPACDFFPTSHGIAYCTVVEQIQLPAELGRYARLEGRHRIVVDGFGTVVLGEMRMSLLSKAISMVRIELGSPYGGELEMCSGNENGARWPPP